jgi:hypothetical protein
VHPRRRGRWPALYAHWVEVEITPKPSDEERAAIAAALELALGAGRELPEQGLWWETGLHDQLAEET